jgi:type III secretion system FlhB-like substrate exporter
MKNQKISHGKVRAHIAFNIYKAMIQMAKSEDISLNYRNNANNHLNEIDLDKD